MIRKSATALFCMMLSLCWGCTQSGILCSKPMPEVIPVAAYLDKDGGAMAHEHAGDNSSSRYYVNPDYYHMKMVLPVERHVHRIKTLSVAAVSGCGCKETGSSTTG